MYKGTLQLNAVPVEIIFLVFEVVYKSFIGECDYIIFSQTFEVSVKAYSQFETKSEILNPYSASKLGQKLIKH